MKKAYSYIRMSTDIQLKGDSLRRQTELAKQFAEKNNYDLDPRSIRDIGLSGYTGANVKKGQLGEFMKALREKKREPGTLIVESLDRLSREQPRTVLKMFLELQEHGMSIATLVDNKVYYPESTDPMDLIGSIIIAQRANDESVTKAKRIREAWKVKRDRAIAEKKPMTRVCKNWLRLKVDRSGYEPIPERVAIVKRIFRLYEDGLSTNGIAYQLNREGLKTFRGGKGWSNGYVRVVLTAKEVIGSLQLGRLANGKSIREGEPIPGFLPRVIDDDQFYRVQRRLATGRKFGGGRKGTFISNLFTKIAKCGYCGGQMYFRTSDPLRHYLHCTNAVRKM
jgi:DNA invertase Pin-like site-specific DNA recombinase